MTNYCYGNCPICASPGIARERRLNGNDRCSAGHTYPSKDALNDSPKSDSEQTINCDGCGEPRIVSGDVGQFLCESCSEAYYKKYPLNTQAKLVDSKLMDVVNEQANDEGLWCGTKYASEAYMQGALRRLHEVIEGLSSEECGLAALNAKPDTCTISRVDELARALVREAYEIGQEDWPELHIAADNLRRELDRASLSSSPTTHQECTVETVQCFNPSCENEFEEGGRSNN